MVSKVVARQVSRMMLFLLGRDCVDESAWRGTRLGVEMFWVVSVLGDTWSSWGSSKICTALSATDDTGVEGSAAGVESGVTCCVGVQQLSGQRRLSSLGDISSGGLAHTMAKYCVLGRVCC